MLRQANFKMNIQTLQDMVKDKRAEAETPSRESIFKSILLKSNIEVNVSKYKVVLVMF